MKNLLINPEVMKSLCDEHRARKVSDDERQNQLYQPTLKQEAPQGTPWERIGNVINLGCRILCALGAFACGVAKLKNAFSNANPSIKYEGIGGGKKK